MGPDIVSVEVLKLLEEDFMDALTKFFPQIYDSGEIPLAVIFLYDNT